MMIFNSHHRGPPSRWTTPMMIYRHPPSAAVPTTTSTALIKGITSANTGNVVSKTGNGSPGKKGISTGNGKDIGQQLFQSPNHSKAKVIPAKVHKEVFFFLKQQPSWPYSNQKRYCILKNCKLYYFDSQESMKEGRPQGVIDLINAKLVDPGNDAKLPSSFGIHVDGERPAEGGTTNGNGNNHNGHNNNSNNTKKQRAFIFSVMHAHELGEWRTAIQAVVGDTVGEEEDTHLFEKMVQVIF
ncbi:Pleckstrin homology domain [Trypanosoma melophagium]|uniref:Pleckstrin homology domain n=1 Tax=Trypanosoma melophagium TaxID=715481 RepID=UPI00351A2F55|nr:Pleckstrin homology domain [Trypanosoma melophagium]